MNTSAKDKSSKPVPQRVSGTVKIYREQEGYGFITDGTQEYYFNVHAFKGEIIPEAGMKCEFTPVPSRKAGKSPTARDMVITDATAQRHGDSRIKCPQCGKMMTPRLVTYYGEPNKSYCPYCGALIKDFSKCFIATAVYGDPLDPAVIALRRFRDEALLTNAPGRLFVKLYYRLSPPVAEFTKKHPSFARAVKPLLDRLATRYG